MAEQAWVTFTREYYADNTMLIIENVLNGNKQKVDVIREVLENQVCLRNEKLIPSACKNTADRGSHEKEAGI